MTVQHYNKIVDEYNIRIFRFLMKTLNDKEMSKDLLQETFMKLWEHKDRINPESIKSWLFTTAYHAMLKQIESKNKLVMKDAVEIEQVVQASSTYEDKQFLDHYLLTLTPVQRSIITLRDLEGYNYNEIGNMLQISESQVKVYLFRARQKLKDILETQEARK